MTVKWHNVAALALIVAGLVVLIKTPRAMAAFLGIMRHAGPGHTPDEQFMGLLAFGLILLVITAVTKIIVEANRKE